MEGFEREIDTDFLVAFLVAQGYFTAFSQKRLSTHAVEHKK